MRAWRGVLRLAFGGLSGESGGKSLSLSWKYCWEFGNVCVVGLVVVRGWRGLCCVAVRFWL